MATTKITALVLIAGLVSACGSSSTGPSAPPIPQYGGSWVGTYTVTGCTQSGGIALGNICGSIGGTPPYAMSFQQNGSSVTGSFTLGTISFPSTGGTIGSDGSLGLSATSFSNGISIFVTWALRNTGTQMSGTITQVWTSTTLSGQANVAGTIGTAQHGASVVRSTALPVSLSGLARAVAGGE